MYRGGLTRGRIVELVGAAPKTAAYHLRIARAADRGLRVCMRPSRIRPAER